MSVQLRQGKPVILRGCGWSHDRRIPYRVVAQLEERWLETPEASGSNPGIPALGGTMSNMMRMLRRPQCNRGCCGGEREREAQRPAERRRVQAEIDMETYDMTPDAEYAWLEYMSGIAR
ncbi:hypothetical protein SEA_REINDEER_101 [Mycobacterium phage Reindeer]|uniref:Uncharacterized protein n=1 Tax=Mycobacterium phage Reindeer TaxID=2762283 RepID=A0A7G8LI32_9CAUD|nr:hypothetical protein J4U05_gp139 [Mycobacterium phage Reindeer]QNJ56904.1 hypothetical protein SEA_REINDEER_101 [Mycobacterium phage Reindeer]